MQMCVCALWWLTSGSSNQCTTPPCTCCCRCSDMGADGLPDLPPSLVCWSCWGESLFMLFCRCRCHPVCPTSAQHLCALSLAAASSEGFRNCRGHWDDMANTRCWCMGILESTRGAVFVAGSKMWIAGYVTPVSHALGLRQQSTHRTCARLWRCSHAAVLESLLWFIVVHFFSVLFNWRTHCIQWRHRRSLAFGCRIRLCHVMNFPCSLVLQVDVHSLYSKMILVSYPERFVFHFMLIYCLHTWQYSLHWCKQDWICCALEDSSIHVSELRATGILDWQTIWEYINMRLQKTQNRWI